ncbi:MAG: DUF2809 domain-containing protein [Aestuariibaculum sp.]
MKIQFNKTYFITGIVLLLTEVLIAVYIKSGFIRHTFGDFLVVILMFAFIRSFFYIDTKKIVFAILIFSYIIEFLQLTPFLKRLHLENSRTANLILGNTFSISDLIAYTLGAASILTIHFIISRHETLKTICK